LNKINSGQIPSTGDRKAFLKAMVDASVSEHIISHRRSLTQLDKIILNFHSAPNPVKQSFSQELTAWLIHHMIDFDAPLKAVFKLIPNRVV